MHRQARALLYRSAYWSLVTASVMVATLNLPLQGQNPILPEAPNAEVFSLNPKPGYFTEPSVAVNGQNPQQVVAVFQDNARAAYSTDAGHTWNAAEGVAPANYKVSGDVSTTWDNQGHVFVCYIAFDKLGSFNYWAHGASRNGVFVRRSLDGGKTWEANHTPVAEQVSRPGIPFEDKPYIVSDTSKSRYAGNLYVGWTRWTLTNSQMVLSRSTDDGQTWSQPIEIDRHPGLPRDDNGAAEGFAGTVGPDGRLYAVWSQDDDLMLTVSHDGGKTFSRARPIVHTAPIMFAIETLDRANGFPQIAIDPRGTRLYVTWSDYRNGDLDVFCSTSTDGGKKWSAPVRVNNDTVHNGAEQFFQWLAVDPVDGSANVIFYDRRGDPKNLKQTVTLARSTDGGQSFQNFAWTTEPFEAGGVFFGDYSGLAAFGGRVYGVWTEKPLESQDSESKTESKPENKSGELAPKPRGTVVKVGVADFQTKPK
ncbi:MAG: sialidase family protein [Candidatus Sulfotelmatobacter sp.]